MRTAMNHQVLDKRGIADQLKKTKAFRDTPYTMALADEFLIYIFT